jgi:hypothetical protein
VALLQDEYGEVNVLGKSASEGLLIIIAFFVFMFVVYSFIVFNCKVEMVISV